MHELGIISNLFSIIEEVAAKNSLAKITSVTLKIGKLQQIVPEMLTFAFETVAQGTKAADANLYVEYIPIKMQCNNCEEIFVIEEHVYICPICAHTSLAMLEGQEIFLESLEGEQA